MSARETLKDRDERFRSLFEESPQPMWVFRPRSHRFIEVNAAAVRLYGYSRAEFRKLKLTDLQVRGQSDAGAGLHRTKSGVMIDVEMASHTIEYGGKKAELAVVMDVTGRRRLEEQLRQAQKMEAVGMLAGGVAHDFNNLLTIITGYGQLVLNSLDETDPNHASVEQIMKAGERAAALTGQLLAFSRRQVLQPRVLDLNKLVTSLSAMLRRLIGEDIDLRLGLGADLGRVNADPNQLEQVLMNLVINARDAMPRGGVLTVETRNVDLDSAYVGRHMTVKSGPYVLLAVSDTGIGMDEATKAHLFEPFFTTKGAGKGTGLGLSTVLGVVKQSGGSVQVYSEAGRGTSVKVYVPRIDQPVFVESAGRSQARARGTETILVVEDDEMVRHLVRETLQRDGYTVIHAAGPAEAHRVVDRHKGPIGLLITDVVMPQVGGWELAAQLTRKRPGLQVLYMSGYAGSAVLNAGLLEGEVAFLAKPFTPAALSEKVREALEGGKRTQRAAE